MDILMDADAIRRALDRIAREIMAAHADMGKLVLIGIKTRGVPIARRLQDRLRRLAGTPIAAGSMDITLYRDDWTRIAEHPVVDATDVLFSVDGKELILVDDVLFTGRTVRAAIDAIMDFGRPDRVELAVVVDRGHRELPIQPDYVGLTAASLPEETVNVLLVEHDGVDRVDILRHCGS
ncbi:MAG: bifunctional pyr operon transcriptional regulator/uracil phosphoribosyltransferase PyrR [Desulfobacterales bacterium]|jgi:pyrimidine operon attenuation protein/uracil phosphoribosyltransferase